MNHFFTFEKWQNTALSSSSKMRKMDNVFGLFDNELPKNDEIEYDKKTHMKDILYVKDVLDDNGIDSEIEILDEDSKNQVGQYHILTFEHDGTKLYSKGEYDQFDRELWLYNYNFTDLCDFEIKFANGWKTYIEKKNDDKYKEFNDLLTNPNDEDYRNSYE